MANKQIQFDQRLRRLSRKHQAMSRGYVARIQSDGLIVATPKRRSFSLPMRAIVLFVVGFIGFKAFLVATLGIQTYDERLARLNDGTIIEQAGAYAMQADPLTTYAAVQIRSVLR